MAEKESLPSIGPVKGKIIADIIKDYKPKRILEIGTLYGYFAILVGCMLLEENVGKVTTLEIDKGSAIRGIYLPDFLPLTLNVSSYALFSLPRRLALDMTFYAAYIRWI